MITILEKKAGKWETIKAGATGDEADAYLLSHIGQPAVVKEVLDNGQAGYFCCREEEHAFYQGKGMDSFLVTLPPIVEVENNHDAAALPG